MWLDPGREPFLLLPLPCETSSPRDQIGSNLAGFSQGLEDMAAFLGLGVIVYVEVYMLVLLKYLN